MTRRQRTINLSILVLVLVVVVVCTNRYFEVAGARAVFEERYDNAMEHLRGEGTEVLDWNLVRSVQGSDDYPDELQALDGQEVKVIGFVTPYDTGRLRIYGGSHSNYDNPLTYDHVSVLDLSPLPKQASFFGSLPVNGRVRVRLASPHGTKVHADYPQVYSGTLLLEPDAEDGVLVQLTEAEHLTPAED